MGFGLPSQSSGSGKPYLKYDGRAGRLHRVDRAQGADGMWSSTEVDITRDAAFVADFANVRIGFINYPKGAAPQKVMVPYGTPLPQRPNELGPDGRPIYRDGFEFDVVLHKTVAGNDNGQAREVSSTAKVAIDGFGEAFEAYLAAPEKAAGKLPVLKLVDTVAVKSGQSTNYRPVFKIMSWVDRPPGLSGVQAAPAPAPVRAPEPVGASADDFPGDDFG
jgi:hypothetical protein